MSELTPEARRMLMAARAAAEPTEADRARVAALIAGTLAVTGTSTAAASVAAKGSSAVGTGLWMKLGAMVLVSFGGGYALHAYTATTKEVVPHAQVVSHAMPHAQPTAARAPSTTSTAPAKALDPTSAPRPIHAPTKRSAHTRSHVAEDIVPSPIADEIAMLGRADAALQQGDPKAALRALQDHAARFPDGELRQERWGLRVIALCTLNVDDAARESRLFLQRHAHSVLAQRVESACKRP